MTESAGEQSGWRRWWYGRSFETKAAIVFLAVIGLVVGGWLLADSLGSASASADQTHSQSQSQTLAVRTVRQIVTVRAPAKVVTVRAPGVRQKLKVVTTPAKPTTVYNAQTVYRTVTVYRSVPSASAPARTVTQVVTTTVPQVQWRVVTVVERPPPTTVTVTTP